MIYGEIFLHDLFQQQHKTTYARITSLTLDERPIERIEGRVTAGSVNLDGASAIRRTCSLTLLTEKADLTDYYWGLNTKFKLEIGISNNVDTSYPNICWFKQGIYLITSFSQAFSVNNYTINISGKDKMCLLNGEVSGSLPSQVDFGTIEEIDKDGNTRIISLPIKQIIREAVHQYGGEPYHNIIINDLDKKGVELQEYKYDTPMYFIRQANTKPYINATINANHPVWVSQKNADDTVIINKTMISNLDSYDNLSRLAADEADEGTIFTMSIDSKNTYQAAKLQYGWTAGYKETELTYAGDLIANIGESITSVLDKIKNMLGIYEYFYDVDGRFIFQQKKDVISTTWTPDSTDSKVQQDYLDTLAQQAIFSFSGSEQFTAFNNTPNLNNVRNDYVVWGTRKSVTGKELTCHMRYAIDRKPTQYTTIEVSNKELEEYNKQYGLNVSGQIPVTYSTKDYDWREIIYQMAADYYKYGHLDDFLLKIIKVNKDLYPEGVTGYEQYYIDMNGFWRQLYNPQPYIKVLHPKAEDIGEYYIYSNGVYEKATSEFSDQTDYYILSADFYPADHKHQYWSKQVYEEPHKLPFWIDFLDSDTQLSEFAVPIVKDRPKVVNDKDVKAIYYREVPGIIFKDKDSQVDEDQIDSGYRYLQLESSLYSKMFSPSAQGKSAKEAIDELLYKHAYCVNSVTIASAPIYHLEPNSIIYINDLESGINGYYNVSKLTMPLTYNGTMNITATKIIDGSL